VVDDIISDTIKSVVYLCHKRSDKAGAVKYAVKHHRWQMLRLGAIGDLVSGLKYKTLKSLNHPNVVKTLDLINCGGKRYFVMEYIDGVTLIDIAKKGRRFGKKEIIKFARGLAAAFKYLEEDKRSPFIRTDPSALHVIIRADGSPCVIDIEPMIAKDLRTYASHIFGLRDVDRVARKRECVRILGKYSLRMALPPAPPPRIYQADKARLGELKRRAIERGYDEDLVGLAVASVENPDAVAFADWERVLSASA